MQILDVKKQVQSFDEEWYWKEGMYDALSFLQGNRGKCVCLPHDYMIEQPVTKDAPAGPAMGYFDGKIANYTKHVVIPEEWKNQQVILHFDGVMMNATVEVNGSRVALHHYGYTPFDVDLTERLDFGCENRITVTCNPSMQPNSRWYTGAGIYRHVTIEHRPFLHIATDGIYTYTKRVEKSQDGENCAYLMAEVTVVNETLKDRMVEVKLSLNSEEDAKAAQVRTAKVFVKKQSETVARIPMTVENPKLWDALYPNLYTVAAEMTEIGIFGVRMEACEAEPAYDKQQVLFGIRTVTADAKNGLRINGETVKLKGGCIHHDHGILGAVSFYDSEYRRIKKMKELGYNAVRMAHNPPSKELMEACDRLGIYVFTEAFDAWGMAKQPGDYSQFFDTDWKADMASFVKRDRNHPSIILWSTGNEIVERGGLGDGYQIAMELAEYMRMLVPNGLITNGLCSYWSGLDDRTAEEGAKAFLAAMSGEVTQMQNASGDSEDTSWEERSEAFVGHLDVVGYNYMDDHYELDHKLYPERVIVGTESYPNKMEEVWSLTQKLSHVIGDFTWTAFDYIGEAGIGKSVFGEPDSPEIQAGPFSLMSHSSKYPWRLANDADIDINGTVLPQGVMRQILWGQKVTRVFTVDPKNYGKAELVSMWGWPDVTPSWDWKGYEGKPIQIVAYSSASSVEFYLNDELIGNVETSDHIAKLDTTYQAGTLRVVGKDADGDSQDMLSSASTPKAIRLIKEEMPASKDDECLLYVKVEIVDEHQNVVTNATEELEAIVTGDGSLLGFGSANPITEDCYASGKATTYRGTALAVIRMKKSAQVKLEVKAQDNQIQSAII